MCKEPVTVPDESQAKTSGDSDAQNLQSLLAASLTEPEAKEAEETVVHDGKSELPAATHDSAPEEQHPASQTLDPCWEKAIAIEANMRKNELVNVGLGKDWKGEELKRKKAEVLTETDEVLKKLRSKDVSPGDAVDAVTKLKSDFGIKSANVNNKLSEFVVAKTMSSLPSDRRMDLLPGPSSIVQGQSSPDYLVKGRDDLIGDNIRYGGIKKKVGDDLVQIMEMSHPALKPEDIEIIIKTIASTVTSKVATYKNDLTGKVPQDKKFIGADGKPFQAGKIFVTLDYTDCPWIAQLLDRVAAQLESINADILELLDCVYVIVRDELVFSWSPPGKSE